jgi:hypothetical protein
MQATCSDRDLSTPDKQPYTCPPGYSPEPGSEMATPPDDTTCCMVGMLIGWWSTSLVSLNTALQIVAQDMRVAYISEPLTRHSVTKVFGCMLQQHKVWVAPEPHDVCQYVCVCLLLVVFRQPPSPPAGTQIPWHQAHSHLCAPMERFSTQATPWSALRL